MEMFIAKDAFDEEVSVSANPGIYSFEWAVENGFKEAPQETNQLDYPQISLEESFESRTDVTFYIPKNSKAEDYYFSMYRDRKKTIGISILGNHFHILFMDMIYSRDIIFCYNSNSR